ncbi:hypothetical protein GRI99_17670 [Altererythrobacter buctensis]|uniref:Uncharacterized protein n=1 Tax=Alteraurantiacibacter buctensis TaxID=1503981 RepID=A0A844YYP8_9SPHN|nr:hypothetical protein [Alteraurantiacibacter buctensis]MXO73455.1 hypothetical protein [Alteraurantiacibacter buctensis]
MHHEIFGTVDARDALAGVRILAEGLPVVEHAASVKLIVENAIPPLAMAGDRAGTPEATARSGNAFSVEMPGYRQWAITTGECFEDLPHDRGLVLVDFSESAQRLTIRAELPDLAITVGEAARDPAILNHAPLPAPHLLAQLLEHDGRHGAAHADMQGPNFPF